MMDEETAYKLTVGEMKEKIEAECNKHMYCNGCPIFKEPGTDCYDTPAQIVKHYELLFGDRQE